MTTPDYHLIIPKVRPDAQWTLVGDDYAGLTWLDHSPKPTKAELDAAWPSVLSSMELAAAQQARAAAYAAESDPLFFKWQRGEGTEAEWLAAVDAIRERYPYSA